jgi:hypothetical protein
MSRVRGPIVPSRGRFGKDNGLPKRPGRAFRLSSAAGSPREKAAARCCRGWRRANVRFDANQSLADRGS